MLNCVVLNQLLLFGVFIAQDRPHMHAHSQTCAHLRTHTHTHDITVE